MSAETIALLTAIIGLIASIVMVWREVKGIHTLINSRMDELLDITRSAARAEGIAEGRDRPSSRDD